MDLIPAQVDGAVVINLVESCNANQERCGSCVDLSVAVHNMLMASELGYVILDLQDEKVVCPALLEEILQLNKRLACPFLFVGVMDGAQEVLNSYSFSSTTNVFETPTDAIKYLKSNHAELVTGEISGVEFGKPLVAGRSRAARAEDGEEVDADS